MTLKDRWIEALRSGKYEQGKGALKIGNKFCCLGVLADIQNAEWTTALSNRGVLLGNPDAAKALVCSLNNRRDVYWPIASNGFFQTELTSMNDNGKTFVEIADWIEKNITPDMLE